MFIVAQSGETYARLQFNVGPRTEIEIPVKRDFTHPFPACEPEAWEQEYLANVHPQEIQRKRRSGSEQIPSLFLEDELLSEEFESWFEENALEGGVE